MCKQSSLGHIYITYIYLYIGRPRKKNYSFLFLELFCKQSGGFYFFLCFVFFVLSLFRIIFNVHIFLFCFKKHFNYGPVLHYNIASIRFFLYIYISFLKKYNVMLQSHTLIQVHEESFFVLFFH